jgi:hypothetical protein
MQVSPQAGSRNGKESGLAMNLAPITLEHGEVYGKLTVLGKVKKYDGRTLYRVGCVCGHSGLILSARKLMSGKVKACRKCEQR